MAWPGSVLKVVGLVFTHLLLSEHSRKRAGGADAMLVCLCACVRGFETSRGQHHTSTCPALAFPTACIADQCCTSTCVPNLQAIQDWVVSVPACERMLCADDEHAHQSVRWRLWAGFCAHQHAIMLSLRFVTYELHTQCSAVIRHISTLSVAYPQSNCCVYINH